MIDDYTAAKRIGERTFRRAASHGDYPYLPVLDDIINQADVSEEHVGLIEIPIDEIVGTKTKGRTQAFARDFMPILSENSEFAMKWSKLYDSANEEGIRDAIKAYEYLRQFYVLEGNKRVSVSKVIGAATVLGDVTRVVPKRSDDKEIKIYFEFLDFYHVCPLYEINFSELGRYARLAKFYGHDLIKPWPEDDVADLRSEYRIFRKGYKDKYRDKIDITTGDAFLIYLRFYGRKDLLGISDTLLATRIEKLKDEFVIESDDDSIVVMEKPEEAEQAPATNIFGFRKKSPYTWENPLKVAFMYEKPSEKSQWIYSHELGRNYIEQKFDGIVETMVYDNCVDNQSLMKNIDDAAAKHADVIFTVSPAQMDETLRSAIHFPDIKFLNCSVNMSQSAVRTYYGRMYEAKFILGFLAGSFAMDKKAGYLASYPIYGSTAEINAFAIGAAMANPEVKIYLAWSSVRNSNWREYFKENNVTLISGPDAIVPEAASRIYGLYRQNSDGTVSNLAMPVWNWGRYYERILKQILEGTWADNPSGDTAKAVNYWWGMSSGVIDVILSDHLSYRSHKVTDILTQAMKNEYLNPFYGELYSQKGFVKGPHTPKLNNEDILTMDWLNDNVIGSLPDFDDLTDEGKTAVRASGIISEKLI